ncbi:hypothetical protein ACFQ7O_12695 [Streptomyces sp. NPDC056485]|uniref:hypothetical protein n=1 Tax=Streptomyces sp. NPDC056485 TaxID=3345834 RepID=UPI003673F30A
MIDEQRDDGWSFAAARVPARFGACEVRGAPGVEHAGGGRGTLCGMAARCLTTHLHLFEPDALQSCRRCRRAAKDAPTEPCVQERLHERVEAAAEGRIREDLLAALRRGAAVRSWINGPSAYLTGSHARLDELTEGAGPAAEALAAAAATGLAVVEDGRYRYLVVLPDGVGGVGGVRGGPPVIARGPRTP